MKTSDPDRSLNRRKGNWLSIPRAEENGIKNILPWLNIVFLAYAVIAAPDNMGTEFIVGFMDNLVYDINYETELFIAASSKTIINVRVRIPLFDPSYDKKFSLNSEEVKQLSLAANTRMTGTSFGSKGILIEADDEIAVYGVNKQRYSNDAFLAFPTDVLGTEYYTVSWFPPTLKCQLMVVGINDSTYVNITLSQALGKDSVKYDGQDYYKGDTINITINRFQTLQLQSYGDLTGTFVSSTKPVAVFSGNKKTMIPSGRTRDHLVEQLPPIKTWGKRFATVTIPDRNVGDRWKFIASEENTFVNITGNTYWKTFTIISKGGHENVEIPSGPDFYCYIQANKPILAMQFAESQQNDASDPSMLTIPPLEQYVSFFAFITPKKSTGSYINYFMFIVKDADKHGLIIDGDLLPATTSYHQIHGTDLVGGYIVVADGVHTVHHLSPLANFIGFIYGRGYFESYGTAAATRLAPINSVCSSSVSVFGDGIDNDCDGLIDEELCTPENSKTDDDGDGKVDEDCATTIPVDGKWGSWSYSACSVNCFSIESNNSGSQTRNRTCNAPPPLYGGELCKSSDGKRVLEEIENLSCSTNIKCSVDGNWGSWSYSACSETCFTLESKINGSQTRNRTCDAPSPQYGGQLCKRSDGKAVLEEIEHMSCSTNIECPVDGNWGSWSYSECSVTCFTLESKINGSQTRNRTCDAPSPQYGGQLCENLDGERVLDEKENVSCLANVECPDTTEMNKCTCPCSAVENSNISKDELMIVFKQTLTKIKVEKGSTTSYKRKLISADDKRTSSKSIGAVGILILVTVLLVFTGNDVLKLASFLYSKFKKRN